MWLLFPPSGKNLKAYAATEGYVNRLLRVGNELEGGVIVETVAGNSLEFPPCTLHAVFTTHGGFLAGINYTEIPLAGVIGEMLHWQFANFPDGDSDSITDTMGAYLEAVGGAINYGDDNLFISVIKSWVDLVPVLRNALLYKTSPVGGLFASFVKDLRAFGTRCHIQARCGCGCVVEDIGTHVIKQHIP
jgi:hypothetical protein